MATTTPPDNKRSNNSNTTTTTSTNTNEMSDLQILVDRIRLSGSPGDEQIDTLACAIANKLSLTSMNQNGYREMAKKMLQLSIVNNTITNTTTTTAAAASSSSSLSSPQQQAPPKSSVSSSSLFGASFLGGGSPQQQQQQQHRRGRSPAARSTINGNNNNNNSDHTNNNSTSSNSSKKRGGGYAFHSPNGGIRSRSPIRQLFGGSGSGTNNSNSNNKIPPTNANNNNNNTSSSSSFLQPTSIATSATTTIATENSSNTSNNSRPRASSPFNLFWRKGIPVSSSSTLDDNNKKSQEEKKDQDTTTTTMNQNHHQHSNHYGKARPGMRDQSPGASPNRLKGLGSGGGVVGSQQQQQYPQGGTATNNGDSSNNTAYQPPKQIFHPSSPVRIPISLSSSSRPSTPQPYGNSTNTNSSSDRPPSRCSSPYNARPGLQEDTESDAIKSIFLGRSPGRAFDTTNTTTTTAAATAAAASQQQQTIMNNMLHTGMASLHLNPSLQTINANEGQQQQQRQNQHRRIHSGGVDTESISKPIPPRAHSRSPMRRPSDDDGDRQPIPPRAFSASPRSRGSLSQVQEIRETTQMNIPDLSMPNFTSPPSNHTNGNSMFTPRVNDEDPDASMAEGVEVEATFNDNIDTSQRSSSSNGIGLKPRPMVGDLNSNSEHSYNNVQFQMGTSNTTRFPHFHHRSTRVHNNSSNNVRTSTGSNTDQPPVPRTPPIPREMMNGSPMDIDEPSPVPPPAAAATTTTTAVFVLGHAETKPKPQRPRLRQQQQQRSSFTESKIVSDIPLPPPNVERNLSSPDHRIASPTPTKVTNDTTTATTPQQPQPPQPDYSGRVAFIASKREEAKVFHMSGDYRSSITAYTDAIKVYGEASAHLTSDTLAVLLSNRAAGLLMLGAYEAAVADCELALRKVTPSRGNEPYSNDSGLLLKIKLSTRLARAYLKLGQYNDASTSFTDAIRIANTAAQLSKANHTKEAYQQNQQTLNQLITEATLGQADTKRLKDACEIILSRPTASLKFPSERIKYAELLGNVNLALSIGSGAVWLMEKKLNILVYMKRWREVAGFCERLAAFNVGMDNAFREDLALKYPFPGVSPAQVLKSDYFGNLRDEDAATRELKLNSRAAAEAVLRLPHSLTPIYLRSMRLEERYPAADAALRSLDDLVRRGGGVLGPTHYLKTLYFWLPKERSKLDRTKEGRELGDELFRLQDFEKAAAKYADTLLIDAEGNTDPVDGLNAGGRLHAVLHCNRAACLMALRRFHAAVDECSNALKIHSRYMKAILRRARCYTRLNRTEEAISEYKKWLQLVEDAKGQDNALSSPCLFDGPHEVKPAEVQATQKELEELYKAKRRADATAKEEADRLRERERQRFQDNFSNSWRASTNANAHDRRDQWYNDQSGSRRWDSFSNRGPRSSSNPRPDSNGTDRDHQRSNSQGRTRNEPLVSPRSNTDHYSVLNLQPNASMDDIKRSFRKLALKYHPDKNTSDGASDNFRRVKLAHEILGDPVKRRQYDAERQLGSRF